MNLVKNVTGSWDSAKNLVYQDLDTIQRTINQILAQINAPTATAVVPPATISPGNHVTTYGSDPLTVVAVQPGGLLTGNGTITSPLSLSIAKATLTLSNTNIATLFSVPVLVIPAPGASQITQVLSLTVRTRVGTGWGSNPHFSLIYAGDAGANTLAGGFQAPLGTAGFDKLNTSPSPSMGPINTSVGLGKAVNARFDADPLGAGTGCSMEVVVFYSVFDF